MTENGTPIEGSHAASAGGSQNSGGSTTAAKADAAKEQAGDLAQQVKDNAGQVAETAKSEAADVASEVKGNARELFSQAQSDLTEQAGQQQKKVAEGLRSIADELHSMAQAGQSGVAADLVGQAADRASSTASWLDGRDPGSLLEEVKGFARERPVAFLAIAAGAGFLAGRLNKGLRAGVPETGNTEQVPEGRHQAAPAGEPAAQGAGHPAAEVPVPLGVEDPFGTEPVRAAGQPPAATSSLPSDTGLQATDPNVGGRH